MFSDSEGLQGMEVAVVGDVAGMLSMLGMAAVAVAVEHQATPEEMP